MVTAVLIFLSFMAITPDKSGLAWENVNSNNMQPFGFSAYQAWIPIYENYQGMMAYPHLPCNYAYWPSDPNADYLAMLDTEYEGVLLWLNEPDREDQCEMTPEDAVSFYWQTVALCPSCQLTYPQVSMGDYYNGFRWLKEFLQLCGGCTFEYGALHIYSVLPSVVIGRYTQVVGDVPILVTEWAACDPALTSQMYHELQMNEHVLKHFYYSDYNTGCSSLLDSEGNLTVLGNLLMELNQ